MQIPGLHVWYGPDTYMGHNLKYLFQSLSVLPDSVVQELHPAHDANSVRDCLSRLHYFQDGTCIVHEIFGGETCNLVRDGYSDAFITAHFEVPGEMFKLALEAQRERGMGVVGSTSNILNFIRDKVRDALQRGFRDRLQFVLGTESGMITSIVRAVQTLLWESGPASELIEVEIVFPVAGDAISTGGKESDAGSVQLLEGLAVVPGPAAGEGCSLEGGCAACPYMKMNSLKSLLTVCEHVGTAGDTVLAAYQPKEYAEQVSSLLLV
jgi:quinolinate synthase